MPIHFDALGLHAPISITMYRSPETAVQRISTPVTTMKTCCPEAAHLNIDVCLLLIAAAFALDQSMRAGDP
jgi:hypothetical protein